MIVSYLEKCQHTEQVKSMGIGVVHYLQVFHFLKGSCTAFIFTVTVNALEGKDCKDSVKLIAESTDLSEEQLAFLISGMYTLLREALRLPLSTFKQEVSCGRTWSLNQLQLCHM